MGNRENLLHGRIAGARKLCEDFAASHEHSRRVVWWARIAAWSLKKLHAALKDDSNG